MFKILVVEDDKELNRTVCAYLGQNGYETLGCLSANEAYDAMYGGTGFDMIISDIMMPQIDGFEFAKTVRELNEEIPILFMTARDDFASKQRGFRVGIDDYMVKPIDLDELLLRIGALLSPPPAARRRGASQRPATVRRSAAAGPWWRCPPPRARRNTALPAQGRSAPVFPPAGSCSAPAASAVPPCFFEIK